MLSVARHVDDGALNSLILPTYNAKPLLAATTTTIERFLRRAGEPWEILFVCDGCTDGTAVWLEEWAKGFGPQVRVIELPVNRGKGHAVRVGMTAARGDFRIFTDVDLAYGMEEVHKIVAALRGGADLAIATRTAPESELLLPAGMIGYVFARKFQSAVFSRIVRLILGIPFLDTQAGLKGMTAATADRLMPALRSNGFEFDCEWLAVAVRRGLTIAEVPVRVRYDRGGHSTTSAASLVRMLHGLWRIRRRVRRLEPVPLLPTEATPRRVAA